MHGNTKHGHRVGCTATYTTWYSMLARCTNPNRPQYKRYGGRGIIVCNRWHKFENFLADMGERPAGRTLDRFPNRNGNYCRENCRWATPKEQYDNQDRDQQVRKRNALGQFKKENNNG